ncbi:conserved membrane protein of unknown function [Nitrospira japonica]|uniref:Uncharacterized protein n=1 Tax=Nitrospira japonica TaxID=1325564 RepID=A0A1W1I5Q5_9BACT|nr:hypothetical protein [Nitrospira japonica]SLM48348.1 conserved membrane protein of unknown function [Nitrospira japonica]
MSETVSHSRFRRTTVILYWACIGLGLTIPWFAVILVDLLKHRQSIGQALHQWRIHLFAPGYNLFLVGLLNAVPFVLLALFLLLHLGRTSSHSFPLAGRRMLGVTTAALAAIGLSAWVQFSTLWFPDAQGALAYIFLPIGLTGLLPVGYAVGRVLGRLLVR